MARAGVPLKKSPVVFFILQATLSGISLTSKKMIDFKVFYLHFSHLTTCYPSCCPLPGSVITLVGYRWYQVLLVIAVSSNWADLRPMRAGAQVVRQFQAK